MWYIPYKYRLMLLFSGIVTISFLLVGVITYFNFVYLSEKSDEEYRVQMASQINMGLDSYFTEADRLAYRVLFDDEMMQILSRNASRDTKTDYLPISDSRKGNTFLSSLSFNRGEIEGISFILENGFIFSNVETTEYFDGASHLFNYFNDPENELKTVIISPHEPAYYLAQHPRVFSLLKEINDPRTGLCIALIKIDFNGKAIDKLVTLAGIESRKIHIMVTQRDGYILFDSYDRQTIPINRVFSPASQDMKRMTQVTSKTTGLSVSTFNAHENVENDATKLMRAIIWICVFAVAFAVAAAFLLAEHTVKPIRIVLLGMEDVAKGHFERRVNFHRQDEIGQLADGFNHMAKELQRLIHEVYEVRAREREAELFALHNQMNPHFICNTLEVVNMMAIESAQFEISDAVSSLGRLLWYTVDHEKHVVPLNEEMRFVEAYFHILKVRYGQRIKTFISVESGLEDCLIPRLILQPIVENAVKHGIGESPGTIELSATKQNNNLLLMVQDDGIGMDDALKCMLEKKIFNYVNPELESQWWSQQESGFALRNIHQRIKLMYGESYGLSIDNTIESGVRFQIKMPVVRRES